ncbi:MAG: hypothetical protein A2001_11115 [Treponema sp. GWC1_61_84]|nr:MAG: hypothetical protein A2001_11115 [Treponema sp. GWC1_61_84]
MKIIDEAKRLKRNERARKKYRHKIIKLNAEINRIILEAIYRENGYNEFDMEKAVPSTLRFLRTGEMNDRRKKQ